MDVTNNLVIDTSHTSAQKLYHNKGRAGIMHRKTLLTLILGLFLSSYAFSCYSADWIRGIYVTQPTLESTKRLKKLIAHSKSVGINTFVIDMARPSKKYRRNIDYVKKSGIRYVARVVVFPNGGKESEVRSKSYWKKKYKLMQAAESLGADAIQLDYIRYKPSRPASKQNVHDILKVLKWYKAHLKVPMEIDVFGETSSKPSINIGQDVQAFAHTIDVLCPMVYPSHYYPYRKHSQQPYQTILKSLRILKKQFNGHPPFKIVPYIEVSNPRYRYTGKNKMKYIYEEIRAVQDSDVDGWYAWSPTNKYRSLFKTMQKYDVK